jgi:hypothetical protein
VTTEFVRSIIDAIVENRRRFEEFCYSLSDVQLDRPVPSSTWIVRDFAAHLGTLDPALTRWFRGAAGDGATTEPRYDPDGHPFDVDAFNDGEVAARRGWPLARVFEEAAENRLVLIAALERLTDEQVEKPMRFGGDAKRAPAEFPLKLFLRGWAQHDPIHVADMLRAVPERASDPDLRIWLENPYVGGYQSVMNR